MDNEYYAPVHPLPVHNLVPSEPVAPPSSTNFVPAASLATPTASSAPSVSVAQAVPTAPVAPAVSSAPVAQTIANVPVAPTATAAAPQGYVAPIIRPVIHPVQAHPAIQQPLPLHTLPIQHRPGHPQAMAQNQPQALAQNQPPHNAIPQPQWATRTPYTAPILNASPQPPQPQQLQPSQPMLPSNYQPRTTPYYPAPQRPDRPKNHVFAVIASALIAAIFASGFTAAAFTLLRPAGGGGLSIGALNPSTPVATLDPGRVDPAPIIGGDVNNPNWQAVAAKVFDSVVSIQVLTPQGGSVGSGFILDDAGHVVTNAHVISGANNDEVQVTLADGRLFRGTIVGSDTRTDLAVVKLTSPPADLHPVSLGDSTTVQVGDPILAVGNPLSLANTVTQGIVSALNRPVVASGGAGTDFTTTNAIQIDAAINPGNSGGPLFNSLGQVIGVNSSIASLSVGVFGGTGGSIGLGFAIPVNLAKQISAQLIDNGAAEHAFLGVGMEPQAATVTVGGVTRRGAQIASVTPGTPAADAGIQVGDVVVAFNGLPVSTHEALTALVGERKVGDHATITIVRDTTAIELEVILTTRAMLDTLLPPEPTEPTPPAESDPDNGDGDSELPSDEPSIYYGGDDEEYEG